MAALERWRITVGEFGQQFDLDFSEGIIVDRVCAGVHHLCHGFIDKREVSGTHYTLACGACGLRILIPREVQTKEQILDFFIQKGFHKKGKEVKVCLECEGRGWKRQTDFKEEDDWRDRGPIKRIREVTTTVDCAECRGTGILQKEAVA